MQQTSLQKNHRASCLISTQGDFPPHSVQKSFFIKDWISGQIEQFGYNPTASFFGLKSTKNEVISTLEIVPESSPKKIQQLLKETTTFQPWKHSFVFVKNLVFNEKRVVEKLCFYQKLKFCLNFSCFLIKKWQEPRKHIKVIFC